ncbi:T-lymphocyte surface antigen Ly-9-like protein [Turdus rufiventris]|nr:T-lymphocyte surface antigen Ly-9-like protein [Turdus rufiventris]
MPQMPMDEFWITLLTMLILLHQTMSASDSEELFGAVGGSVTFLIQDTTSGDVAVWNFEDRHIVTASFGDPPQTLFSKQTLKTRFAVSEKGRALSISQLRLEDSGTYSVKINEKSSTFVLRVYRELAEPTVTCEAQNCSSDGSCHFSLRCSVSGTNLGSVSYTWRMGDRLWNEGPVVLWVDKSDLEGPEPLRCTAQNPVSNRSVTVRASDLRCRGSSSSTEVVYWLVSGIAVPVLLVILFLFFRKFKDATTVYAEVGPSQQRIPNGIKAKPMDGESATTIYTTVKPPDQVENGAVTSLELI